MGDCTFTDLRSTIKIDRLLAILADTPMTRQELAKAACMSPSSVAMYLAHLQLEPRRVRIARHVRNSGRSAPVYALGDKPNQPELKGLPRSAYRKKYLKAIKDDPEKLDLYRSRKAISSQLHKARKKPATWLSVLL